MTFNPDDRVLNRKTGEYGTIVGKCTNPKQPNDWEVRYDDDPGIWDVAESRLELVEQEGEHND